MTDARFDTLAATMPLVGPPPKPGPTPEEEAKLFAWTSPEDALRWARFFSAVNSGADFVESMQRIIFAPRGDVVDRLLGRSSPSPHPAFPDDPCLLWTGAKLKNGYGAMMTRRAYKTRWNYVHRLAWEARFGDIPPGMHVHHVCERTLCVNWDHLELRPEDVHGRQHREQQLEDYARHAPAGSEGVDLGGSI